jgi:hypothetical protein
MDASKRVLIDKGNKRVRGFDYEQISSLFSLAHRVLTSNHADLLEPIIFGKRVLNWL